MKNRRVITDAFCKHYKLTKDSCKSAVLPVGHLAETGEHVNGPDEIHWTADRLD